MYTFGKAQLQSEPSDSPGPASYNSSPSDFEQSSKPVVRRPIIQSRWRPKGKTVLKSKNKINIVNVTPEMLEDAKY